MWLCNTIVKLEASIVLRNRQNDHVKQSNWLMTTVLHRLFLAIIPSYWICKINENSNKWMLVLCSIIQIRDGCEAVNRPNHWTGSASFKSCHFSLPRSGQVTEREAYRWVEIPWRHSGSVQPAQEVEGRTWRKYSCLNDREDVNVESCPLRELSTTELASEALLIFAGPKLRPKRRLNDMGRRRFTQWQAGTSSTPTPDGTRTRNDGVSRSSYHRARALRPLVRWLTIWAASFHH